MGTMLKPDQIDRVPISVPVVIETPTAPSVDTLPMAPQPIRMRRHHWGRAFVGVLKICLLLSEIPIILALVGYAGVVHLLPATPPAAQIAQTGHTVRAVPGVYCWFRPGHADCEDPTAPANTALPQISAAKGGTVALTFAYPPPTACAVVARPAAALADPAKPAGPLVPTGARSLMLAHYALTVGLAPGLYRLDVTCEWSPLAALRWLQGSGSATYTVLLRVSAALPAPPPAATPPAK